jgi:hypothetical protein
MDATTAGPRPEREATNTTPSRRTIATSVGLSRERNTKQAAVAAAMTASIPPYWTAGVARWSNVPRVAGVLILTPPCSHAGAA